MRRFIICLIFLTVLGAASYAQEIQILPDPDETFWRENVDPSSEWGRWLTETYKPYADELKATVNDFVRVFNNMPMGEISAVEIRQKTNAAMTNYYQAVQRIEPPLELEKYHVKLLQFLAARMKADSSDDDSIARLIAGAQEELARVFARRGVPHLITQTLTLNSGF